MSETGFRDLFVEVETIEAKRDRLRRNWMMICMMQTSPEAAKAERAAWKAYARSLAETE